jgi:hypothetical protein
MPGRGDVHRSPRPYVPKVMDYGLDLESIMIARDLAVGVVEVPIRWANQEMQGSSLA